MLFNANCHHSRALVAGSGHVSFIRLYYIMHILTDDFVGATMHQTLIVNSHASRFSKG